MENKPVNILKHPDIDPCSLFIPVEQVQMELCVEKLQQRRAWMIHDHLKCPVVGTCLTMDEQKKILKKAGYSIKNCSTNEIHGKFVKDLSDENRLSKCIDAYLNSKFKKEISEFYALDRSLFLDAWKRHFKKGETSGLLWVAATRADMSEEDICSIFGDIHMQMHLNAAQNMKVRQRLSSQKEENRKLDQRLKESTWIRRALKKENERLEKELEKLHGRYTSLEKERLVFENNLSELRGNTGITGLEAENRKLQEKLRKISGESAIYEQRLKALQHHNDRLVSELESQREINGHFQKKLESNIRQISNLNRCDETCPSFDLCRKRILIVGGITRMESLYRQMIEENGGIFEYHNGHMKGGPKGLENQVRRADVVLCPVNINSHNACLLVKKLGKKYSRPVQMLAGSGLGVISRALSEYQKAVSIQHPNRGPRYLF